MIHQVNIKSLPQEWLWCETWCSDYEKKTAKTIDLVSRISQFMCRLTVAYVLYCISDLNFSNLSLIYILYYMSDLYILLYP